jgi:hypothetical protein
MLSADQLLTDRLSSDSGNYVQFGVLAAAAFGQMQS